MGLLGLATWCTAAFEKKAMCTPKVPQTALSESGSIVLLLQETFKIPEI
jgi:hypothetical protein